MLLSTIVVVIAMTAARAARSRSRTALTTIRAHETRYAVIAPANLPVNCPFSWVALAPSAALVPAGSHGTVLTAGAPLAGTASAPRAAIEIIAASPTRGSVRPIGAPSARQGVPGLPGWALGDQAARSRGVRGAQPRMPPMEVQSLQVPFQVFW
ncbi:hypothetical protein GCM10009687_38680 [Asanoa iriomotensis]